MRKAQTAIGRFLSAEQGSLSYFGLFSALVIAMFGGIAVDLMASEVRRAKVQATLDRSTLAAADFDNVFAPVDVVNDYFDKMNLGDTLVNVTAGNSDHERVVTAQAKSTVDANFTRLLGIQSLSDDLVAQAQEAGDPTEISLVMDISRSMHIDGRMWKAQNAARAFGDVVLSPANEGIVSVSLVQYADQVDAGEGILKHLKVKYQHDNGDCIDFKPGDFAQTRLNRSKNYFQSQQFSWNYYGENHTYESYCPKWEDGEIKPFLGTAASLRNAIDRAWPREGTAIHIGVKWGAALLDPDFQAITSEMVGEGLVAPAFNARPAAFGSDTSKHIVLMSDGENSDTMQIAKKHYSSQEERDFLLDTNLWHHLAWNVPEAEHKDWYYKESTTADSNEATQRICSAAKSRGITIWAVGFELSDAGAAVLEDCATSSAHFFRVEGDEIVEAFESIGRNIVQLRLTQ